MIDGIYKDIQADLDQLRRFIDGGEYTGYPDYYTMRRLASQLSDDLRKLKAEVTLDRETRMQEVVRLKLESVQPDRQSTIDRILEGSYAEGSLPKEF